MDFDPEDPLKWHRESLAGISTPIHDDVIHPGWFKRRLVKGGPEVPVEIKVVVIEGEKIISATQDGKPVKADLIWTYVAGKPITKTEFDFMTARAVHARAYLPDSPEANPRRKINHKSIPPQF